MSGSYNGPSLYSEKDKALLAEFMKHVPKARNPYECYKTCEADILLTRVAELEAENTRLKAELAVRDRAFEKLAIEATREIAQARAELEEEVKP